LSLSSCSKMQGRHERGFVRMTVSQKQLYLDLETLSEEQIEVGLRAGVWGDPARPVVERYLDQIKLARVEAAAAEQLAAARDAISAAGEAVGEVRAMKVWAISALIISAGAMLAAMAAAFVAFLALRHGTISW
jgi:hypothetical protein